MATHLREDLRRLQNLVIRLSTEVGGKNQKLEHQEKMLDECLTSLSIMTEERDHMNQAYNEEKRKTQMTVYENERLMRELETQRSEIEQQGKEIEKLEAQSDFKIKQVLVLSEEVTRKRNIVQRKVEGKKNMSSGDNVQVQLDMNGFHKELEEKDYELDSELNLNQTLIDKEHRSHHDPQEVHKVLIEEVKKEDDEKLIVIDEWGNGDIEGSGVECNSFHDMFPPIPPPESLADPCYGNSSDFSHDLPVPDDEIAEFEWLSTFVDGSLSAGGITLDIDLCNNSKKDDSYRLRTSNPVSVLKNCSSCSGGKTMPLSPDTVVPGRVRSKRPRPAIFIQRPALNLVSPTSCITNAQNLPMANSYFSSESKNFAESHLPYTPNFNGKEQKKKKKKKKRLAPSLLSYSSDNANPLQQQQQPDVAVKKCLHCEITKTPQWREGPMGPRTLCNACGVCYNRGRLLPEYRPATSPTFVASLHSNSHKKVLAMRVKRYT
ncbi:hypothetical protein MKX01_029231 [Papaver californicum]|nr:hypothetical protein MKX01_025086 [Papaver californicum]KAI3994913.1 hypothetical protein MKX01_029231 [Papaver californicum]